MIVASSYQIPLLSYLRLEAAAVFACFAPLDKHDSDFLTFFGEFLLGARVYLRSWFGTLAATTVISGAFAEVSWGERALPGQRKSGLSLRHQAWSHLQERIRFPCTRIPKLPITFLWLLHFALAARRLRGKSDLMIPGSCSILPLRSLNGSGNLFWV